MKLSWSHAVLNVKDEDKILDFYTGILGFTVSDRGQLAENAPDIIFMSQESGRTSPTRGFSQARGRGSIQFTESHGFSSRVFRRC